MVDKRMWAIRSREMWRLIVDPVIKNDILHFEGIYCEEVWQLESQQWGFLLFAS